MLADRKAKSHVWWWYSEIIKKERVSFWHSRDSYWQHRVVNVGLILTSGYGRFNSGLIKEIRSILLLKEAPWAPIELRNHFKRTAETNLAAYWKSKTILKGIKKAEYEAPLPDFEWSYPYQWPSNESNKPHALHNLLRARPGPASRKSTHSLYSGLRSIIGNCWKFAATTDHCLIQPLKNKMRNVGALQPGNISRAFSIQKRSNPRNTRSCNSLSAFQRAAGKLDHHFYGWICNRWHLWWWCKRQRGQSCQCYGRPHKAAT